MSLAPELLLRRIVDGLGAQPLYLSVFGDGCPLLDEAREPPIRGAVRPVGGLFAADGLRLWAPPLDLARDQAELARLAAARPIILDGAVDDIPSLFGRVLALSDAAPTALRVRGSALRRTPTGLTLIYEDAAAGDRIYIRRDLLTAELEAEAAAFAAAEHDEYDLVSSLVASRRIIGLIHGPAGAEVAFAPAAALDQASAVQQAAALAEGRALIDADGGAALFAPQLSARPGAVRIAVAGLQTQEPDPSITLPNAPDWRVETHREGTSWRARAIPPEGASPLVSLFIELIGPPGVEVTELAIAVRRRRGAWEMWDEAQKQLELEESW